MKPASSCPWNKTSQQPSVPVLKIIYIYTVCTFRLNSHCSLRPQRPSLPGLLLLCHQAAKLGQEAALRDKAPLRCLLQISSSSEVAPKIHPSVAACDPYCSHRAHRVLLLCCAWEVQACKKSFQELTLQQTSMAAAQAEQITAQIQADTEQITGCSPPDQLSGRILSRKTPHSAAYFCNKYAKAQN